MSSTDVIAILAEEASFDPRTLKTTFPERVLEACSVEAIAFFDALSDTSGSHGYSFSLDALLTGRWQKDAYAKKMYQCAQTDARLEIHAIIGAVLHEMTHKVDLLISPVGVQTQWALLEEYLILQRYIPIAMQTQETLPALEFLKLLTEDKSPPNSLDDPTLSKLWKRLSRVLRHQLSWGDLGHRRPAKSQIKSGWADAKEPKDLFSANILIEPVTVLGTFLSFRPLDAGNWYVRPMTIFESKALANVMLYLFSISDDSVADLRLYYRACYLSKKETLQPDYLFLFDIVTRICGFKTFDHALEKGTPDHIRSILYLVSSISWFALQSPPLVVGQFSSEYAFNPSLRLFVALRELSPLLRSKYQPYESAADLLMLIEQSRAFKAMKQAPIKDTLEVSMLVLDDIKTKARDSIWNPDVRNRFIALVDIKRPFFEERDATYASRFGMPADGNPRLAARNLREAELFAMDHHPLGDMSDWLKLRDRLFFTYTLTPKIDDAFVTKLDNHFRAHCLTWRCQHCMSIHPMWVSRFADPVILKCPSTGEITELDRDEIDTIYSGT